jgi:hypothetical protein
MSAREGKTDVPREPGHFRFRPIRDMWKMFPSDIIHAVPEFIWGMSGDEY